MVKREVQTAVLRSRLEWPARLVLLTLLSLDEESVAPPDRSLSLNELKTMTGLSRSSVARWLGELERLGWVTRTRPQAPGSGQRTCYSLTVGDPGPATAKPTRTYCKAKIPTSVRILVALRYGAKPGEGCYAPCYHCGLVGWIDWPLLRRTAHWVAFEHELDHLVPEVRGGATVPENLALACSPCNRRKGSQINWSPDALGVNSGA